MTGLPWLLFLLFLGLFGCSNGGTADDDGFGQLCTPNNYVFCRCDEVSYGTKRCSVTGKSFGPCVNCQSGEIPSEGCSPGVDYPCDCEDGSEGLYTCQEDGISFGACRDCGSTVNPGGDAPTDACPGGVLSIDPGQSVERTANTFGAVDHFDPFCATRPGPDVVYQVLPSASGFLTARVQGAGLADPVLYSWGGNCGGSTKACSDSSGSGGVEELTVQANAGEPAYFGIDTAESEGEFTFSIQLDTTGLQGDACPGIPVAVGPKKLVALSGTTAGAQGDFSGALECSGAGGGDIVYAVQPSANGLLTARLAPQGFDATLYVRESSCDAGPQIACSAKAPAGGEEEVSFSVSVGKIYNVFIDGSSEGAFELSLDLSQEFCGDGKGTSPEQCDDGNTFDGDGCSSQCKLEQNPPDATCPGVGVFVFDTPLLFSGSTDSYGDFEAHPSCGGTGGPDRVFRVIPGMSGTLRAKITSTNFDLLLYARKGTCSGSSAKDLGCDDKFLGGSEIQLDLPVNEGEPVWLVVDGYQQGEKGIFALSLSIE